MVDPSHLHPEDRPDADDEAGPWTALVAGAAALWVVLVALDRRLLVDGTALWATVRSLHTLVLAPLAAALVQDTRAERLDGVRFGRLRWCYGLATLLFPPSGWAYLLHRRVRRGG
ncbi:MAG: hypothetical protein ABEH47_05185 [Haloferacaceae archaeon]